MHCKAGPPIWKLIQKQNHKRTSDDWTDRRIYYTATQGILTRGPQLHAMHATTGRMNDKKSDADDRTERRRDGETEKRTDI